MELVLTDKGRAELEKEWDIQSMIHRESGVYDYGEDNKEIYAPAEYIHRQRQQFLILIDNGTVGSGDHAFSSWDEFKAEYRDITYTVIGQLLQGGYITVENISEEYL